MIHGENSGGGKATKGEVHSSESFYFQEVREVRSAERPAKRSAKRSAERGEDGFAVEEGLVERAVDHVGIVGGEKEVGGGGGS